MFQLKILTNKCLCVWSAGFFACLQLVGCATHSVSNDLRPVTEDYPQLPTPNITLNIEGLGPCDDNPDRSLRLNSREPVTVLVHGCYGSAGRFRTLAQVLAFHGQQSACFGYNDRDKILKSSRQLADAVEALATQFESPEITVIGHSQGGLVARKALVSERDDPINLDAPLRLVTVSAPLSGIHAARFCGIPALRIATLGLQDVLCWLVSGNKWYEITSSSDFIKKPGALVSSVESYLMVTTDEKGSCRLFNDAGQCLDDDFVFTLDEQELPPVPLGIDPRKVSVRAGHVEIVGESGATPRKLIKILQQEGYIRPTDPSRTAQLNALLARLYDAQLN